MDFRAGYDHLWCLKWQSYFCPELQWKHLNTLIWFKVFGFLLSRKKVWLGTPTWCFHCGNDCRMNCFINIIIQVSFQPRCSTFHLRYRIAQFAQCHLCLESCTTQNWTTAPHWACIWWLNKEEIWKFVKLAPRVLFVRPFRPICATSPNVEPAPKWIVCYFPHWKSRLPNGSSSCLWFYRTTQASRVSPHGRCAIAAVALHLALERGDLFQQGQQY